MTKNKDFHSVEFFRKVRDEHASLLRGKPQEEIIAFFCDQKAPKSGSRPASQRGGPLRTGRASFPASGSSLSKPR